MGLTDFLLNLLLQTFSIAFTFLLSKFTTKANADATEKIKVLIASDSEISKYGKSSTLLEKEKQEALQHVKFELRPKIDSLKRQSVSFKKTTNLIFKWAIGIYFGTLLGSILAFAVKVQFIVTVLNKFFYGFLIILIVIILAYYSALNRLRKELLATRAEWDSIKAILDSNTQNNR